jgi:hypothetical protein
MKKLFTLATVIIFSLGAFAQQIPNGGFETWSSSAAPDGWGDFGNITGIGMTFPYFTYKDTTTFVEGHTSVKMVTDTLPASIGGQVTPSLVGLGTMGLNFATMMPTFTGIPYTKKPDSLYFSVKYAPAAVTDSGQVVFTLNKAGVSLFGGMLGGKIPNTQGAWVTNSFYLTPYYTGGTLPDTLMLLFVSSTDTGARTMGTTLWVDAVHFDASVNIGVGIQEINGKVQGVNAYPNPTTDKINITVEQDEIGSSIQLFDMTGREVYTGTLTGATTTIDTHSLQAGIYSIRVNSIDQMTTYKGKITVTK